MPKIQVSGIDFYYQYLPKQLSISESTLLPTQSASQSTPSISSDRGQDVLVYVHGLIMDNLSSAYFTFAHKARHYCNVLLYDLRGHGKTTISPQGYHIDQQVHDLYLLLHTLDLVPQQRIHLIGCSFGGALASAYASTYPQHVASLILLDAHQNHPQFFLQLRADLQKKGQARTQMIAQHFQHWLHRDKERKRKRLIQRAEQLIFHTSLLDDLQRSSQIQPPVDSDVSADLLANSSSQSIPQSSTQSIPQSSHTNIDHDALTQIPILGLYGKNSDAYQQLELFKQKYPHMQLKVFDQASHALLWEQTEQVIQALETWLSVHCESLHTHT